MNNKVLINIVNDFCIGKYDSDLKASMWDPVFQYISEKHESLKFDKERIHSLWTINGGHIRRKINDDALVAKVLAVSLPGYAGEGLELYRGECRFLYESNKIGFSWTPEVSVAEMFASGLNALESGGVLLKAYAPSNSIYAEPNSHSVKQMEEFEYTCNPFLLEDIQAIQYFEKH